MAHPNLARWEKKLKAIFDDIDLDLEQRFGDRYPLHPARAPHGSTSNPEHSGLFNVGAAYSAGYGSDFGPGYVVEVRLSTLAHVPKKIRTAVEDEVVDQLEERLPVAFPGRDLHVKRDGQVYKIFGDLSLDQV